MVAQLRPRPNPLPGKRKRGSPTFIFGVLLAISVGHIAQHKGYQNTLPDSALSEKFEVKRSSRPRRLNNKLGSHRIAVLSVTNIVNTDLFINSDITVTRTNPTMLLTCLFTKLLIIVVVQVLTRVTITAPSANSFSACTSGTVNH